MKMLYVAFHCLEKAAQEDGGKIHKSNWFSLKSYDKILISWGRKSKTEPMTNSNLNRDLCY